MSLRPDLAACWVYRIAPSGGVEILVIRRAPGQMYPGLWQCVTGKIEPGERIVDAALREFNEETGLGDDDLEAFLETDLVNTFHDASLDALLVEAVFAARVRADAEVRLSAEHDAFDWLDPEAACARVVWPAYARAIDFVAWLVGNPDRAAAFHLR